MKKKNTRQPIESKVLSRIYGHGRGWCFTPSHFSDLGNQMTINTTLFRLARKGTLRKVAHGIYDYPRFHKILGIISPNVDKVVEAISYKLKIKTQPTGAYAANLLGLSEQVPGRAVYLTDGSPRKFKIGKLEVSFIKTTPRNMIPAGTVAGLLIQAFKYMTKKHIDDKMINWLKSRLSKEHLKTIKRYSNFAPRWIFDIIHSKLLK